MEQNPFLNPEKYLQPQPIPENETMGEFIRWWKAQCAVWDSQLKHIVRSDPNRWSSGKKGKRK